MNIGFTTAPFMLGRGVRQGDPLSPYLFIIALETLVIKIRSDNSINGFRIGGELTKLSLFADDMTCFLHDKESFSFLLATLESFGLCSGLRVNHGKTEMLALGSNNLEEKDLNNYKICDSIKILGVYFGYDFIVKKASISWTMPTFKKFHRRKHEKSELMFPSFASLWRHTISRRPRAHAYQRPACATRLFEILTTR